jgi:hypothetical protein
MSQLSAKDYILTRARTLPIYKCFVGKNWEDTKFIGIIVMRKHNNGNVTAGYYYIDLHCLGVKGTRYYFNVEEKEIFDAFPELPTMYKEADYPLVHNIIYAGHDYAMDFEIGPHKDFEITRFILEEDDDNIPLIEIETGDKGQPHLILIRSNERPDALAKLKKHAGEGNYYYTVLEEEKLDEYFLDNIPIGKLDCKKVLTVETEDLEDDEKLVQRDPIEQVIINAELYTRLLPEELTQVDKQADQAWKKNWMAELSFIATEPMEKHYKEYNKAIQEIISDKTADFEDKVISVCNKYAHNPVVTAMFYEQSILMSKEKITPVAKAHAEKLAEQYPLVQISLALGALVLESIDNRYDAIYNAESIRDIYPGETVFYMPEFANFALVKMWQRIAEKDVAFAVMYYKLIANSGGEQCNLTPVVWGHYLNLLLEATEDEEEEDDDTGK